MRLQANTVGKVTRADGRELRRLVVYLPPGLMARLRVLAAETGFSLSKITSVAVANYLDGEK